MRISLIFLSVLVLLASCNQEDDSAAENPYAAKILAQLNPTDTFRYEVPKSNTQWDSAYTEIRKRNLRYLKLESLERGFDSIQIRIWYDCINMPHFLVIFENLNGKWHAEISKVIFPKTWYQLGDSISRKTLHYSPKSGWNNFINQLFDLKILSLPDEERISGFEPEHVMDGCSASVEIATKNVYRSYQYNNPRPRKYWQAKNMMLILRLINNEFEIQKRFKPKYLWPNDEMDKFH